MALTYREVGATADAQLPAGYRHLEVTGELGPVDVDEVGEALLSWRLHRRAGVRMRADGPAEPGRRVVTVLGLPPLGVAAPCEVVRVTREPGRYAFAYGTLPGHPFTGEEEFRVELDGRGRARMSVRAFSRPVGRLGRLLAPLLAVGQRVYSRHLIATARRMRQA
ncbi:conserved hypothetical protein [Beutenbergia cavernae DSM 12333]|uniref:DUF1990 domain-containing protein n=1 Tax=Beutenbergia cavernae (strain ATCC BAA-8 / DSM 12333 / CCUG 43141 / JCM 11478 / NBRC 16432 / NCIMB 13614 / HKI 0122) TaxID=471853 RepID=C5C1V4_BEUC1|nr:DUF1990 domain-containing protein [Beutenbergia cavernae]ACQ79572.1 conserved hypothetical protein [Beutenbergia cavernae DSM 12333]